MNCILKRVFYTVTAVSLAIMVMAYPAEAAFTETIDGKEYRIEAGEKAGTWRVSYGDDSFLWEPASWMDPELRDQGPEFQLRWSKPGLPFPWDIDVAERVRLAKEKPGEIMDRYHDATVFFAFGKAMIDTLEMPLTDARGQTRTKIIQEWGQYYWPMGHNWQNLSEEERGTVARKYMWVMRSPAEVQGQGGRTVGFLGNDRRPDEWLYLPSVRKVRRLAASVSQDYLPGTIVHLDQVSHTSQLPDLDYKLVGVELWKGDPTAIGFRPEDNNTDITYGDGKPQPAIDRTGDIALVFEITPKPGVRWWYSKLYRRIALHGGYWIGDDAYDAKGERIQTVYLRNLLPPSDLRGSLPQYYVHLGQMFMHEPKTGLWGIGRHYEPAQWDVDVPKWLFNPDTLLREPGSLTFW